VTPQQPQIGKDQPEFLLDRGMKSRRGPITSEVALKNNKQQSVVSPPLLELLDRSGKCQGDAQSLEAGRLSFLMCNSTEGIRKVLSPCRAGR